jgi:hypothetical protein
VVEVRRI